MNNFKNHGINRTSTGSLPISFSSISLVKVDICARALPLLVDRYQLSRVEKNDIWKLLVDILYFHNVAILY